MEEIFEEREEGRELDDVCFCMCSCGEFDDGEGEWELVEWMVEMELEVEGMGWVVDLGIWVMCLGVGYLVFKVFIKFLRSGGRRR